MLSKDRVIQELIGESRNLVFLVGSGVSIEEPSLLVSAQTAMKHIINYICAETEIEELLELDELKFENLIQILNNQLDPNLKILDYYGLCEKPNFQHFYLAEMIKEGNTVFTTNFDSLIEQALLHLDIEKESILPIITEIDYNNFQQNEKILQNGLFPVIKLHGSLKNIISNQDTKDYLINLMNKIGSQKLEVNLLQLEPFKQNLIEKLLFNKILIVIGYSGLNDVDVIPILKKINNFRKIFWINHISRVETSEDIKEIKYQEELDKKEVDHLQKILIDLKKYNQDIEIWRINANTNQFLKSLSISIPKIEENKFDLDFSDWLKQTLPEPSPLKQCLIPHIIYFNFNRYSESYRCGITALEQIKSDNDISDKVLILNNLGWINYSKGNYFDALEQFEEALKIAIELGNEKQQAIYYNNLGEINEKIMNFPEALSHYTDAIDTAENASVLIEKQRALTSIIEIFEHVQNFPKALDYYQQAIQVAENIGDLKTKAIYLNNIASIYCSQEDFSKALEFFQQSGEILRDIDDKEAIAINLNNIGALHQKCGYFSKALENFNLALQINEAIGNEIGVAKNLYKIAGVYFMHEEYPEAITYYIKAKELLKTSGEFNLLANLYNDLGKSHYYLKQYPEALDAFNKGIEYGKNVENLQIRPGLLNNIASCYYMQLNYEQSLQYAKEALQALKLLGYARSTKASSLRKRISKIEKQLGL